MQVTTISQYYLRYQTLKIDVFNCVTSVISVVLRETTLTISDLTGEPVTVEPGIERVVSLIATEISEITRLTIRYSGSEYLNHKTHFYKQPTAKSSDIYQCARIAQADMSRYCVEMH